MSSVPQQAETLQRILEEETRQLARETGFIERERAFNGADFAQAMILGWLQHPDERLEGFTQILERRDVSITASGLSQRFTKEAATFMQRVLERLAEVQMQVEAVDVPLLRRFSAVRVEDSSVVPLPQDLADIWRGCGGSAGMSEAALKLFVRWDVLAGKLEGPRLTDGRHSDNKSPFNDEDLPVGGLYLADLGFFALWRLQRLAKRREGGKRFFVMRLQYGTGLYTRRGSSDRAAWHPAPRGGRGQRDGGAGGASRRNCRCDSSWFGCPTRWPSSEALASARRLKPMGENPQKRSCTQAGLDPGSDQCGAGSTQFARSLDLAAAALADRTPLPLVERVRTDRRMAQ
jgi:hypothetical protein